MSIQNVSEKPPVATAPTEATRSAPRAKEAKASAPVEQPARAQPAAPSIEAVAERLDRYIKSVNRSLEFRVDSPSGRTVISVRDADTGELIRQIPNEEVLRFAQMTEDDTVVLLHEKV